MDFRIAGFDPVARDDRRDRDLALLPARELAEDQRRNLEIKADKERMSAELAAAHNDLTRLVQENRFDRDIADTMGKISLRENFVQIMGSSLNADRVPEYLARFWLRCYAEPKMMQIEAKQKEFRAIGNEWVGI